MGSIVNTKDGRGVVEETNLLTGKLRVKIDKTDNVVTVDKADVEVIKEGWSKVNKNEMKALKDLEDN